MNARLVIERSSFNFLRQGVAAVAQGRCFFPEFHGFGRVPRLEVSVSEVFQEFATGSIDRFVGLGQPRDRFVVLALFEVHPPQGIQEGGLAGFQRIAALRQVFVTGEVGRDDLALARGALRR